MTTTKLLDAAPKPTGHVRRFIHPLVERRTYLDTRSLLADLPLGIFWFTVTITGLSLGLGLAITVVGVPVLVATLVVVRAGARMERDRARARRGIRPGEAPTIESASGIRRERLKILVSDQETRNAVAYLCLLLPFGIASFSVVVTFWTMSLALITLPTWNWALPGGGALLFSARNRRTDGFRIHTGPELAGAVALGIVLLVLTPWVVRGIAAWKASMVRAFLTPAPSG